MSKSSDIRVLRQNWLENPLDALRIFEFAVILSHSDEINDKKEALDLFHQLLAINKYTEDSLYYLALTYRSLGQFNEARKYCEDLYRQQPDSLKVKELHEQLTSEHKAQIRDHEDTAIAVTGVVAVAVAVIAGLGILFSKRK